MSIWKISRIEMIAKAIYPGCRNFVSEIMYDPAAIFICFFRRDFISVIEASIHLA